MTRWDDSFLHHPAADLVDASLAVDALRADPAASPATLATAQAAYDEAVATWKDAETAWTAGLEGGWLDPELSSEPEAGG